MIHQKELVIPIGSVRIIPGFLLNLYRWGLGAAVDVDHGFGAEVLIGPLCLYVEAGKV